MPRVSLMSLRLIIGGLLRARQAVYDRDFKEILDG